MPGRVARVMLSDSSLYHKVEDDVSVTVPVTVVVPFPGRATSAVFSRLTGA